ncbi:MAG: GntR family transcriptional regulator [Pseudomonadota bacterium]
MARFTKSECLDDLKTRILSLELAPGTDLDEVSLSAHYGISRTPLREVLQRLSGEGYVEAKDSRGAKVSGMDLSVMRTFFQTAPMVYANIAHLAATHHNTAHLDVLKGFQTEFKKATDNKASGQAALWNYRFHEQIGLMAQNTYLMACLKRLLIDHTRLSQTFYRPADPSEAQLVTKAVEQHDAMIAAFEAREAALAMDLTLQHWDLSRDQLERFVHPDPLPANVISFKDHPHAV